MVGISQKGSGKEIHVRQVAHSIWQNEFIRESRKSPENLS